MKKFYPDEHLNKLYQVIYIESHGDYWINRDEVLKNLYNTNLSQPVLLHFLYEAMSIQQSGLLEVIDQYIDFSQRHRSSIFIHTPNCEEYLLGFKNLYGYPVSHHFLQCRNFWVDIPIKPESEALRFGYFVGRPTTPRIKFFYDIEKHNIKDKFLLSKLHDTSPGDWHYPGNHYDNLSHWFDSVKEQNYFSEWYKTCCSIPSIDNLNLRDQYDVTKTARLNLVNQSWRYYVDIVFETSTLGNTFMPTEKLIRSLITEKPFVVFAPKNYMQRLKNIGFQTFDKLWNEDYDNFDFVDRYNKILDLVIKLSNLSNEDFSFLIESSREICIHNKKILRQINIDYYGSEQQWINNTSNLLIS